MPVNQIDFAKVVFGSQVAVAKAEVKQLQEQLAEALEPRMQKINIELMGFITINGR